MIEPASLLVLSVGFVDPVAQLPSPLQSFAETTLGRLFLSSLIAVFAFGGAYLIRQARVHLSDRVAPLAVDLAGAALTVVVAVLAVAAVAEIWGQYQILEDQLTNLDLTTRAPQIAVTIVVLIAVQVLTGILHRLLADITEGSDAVSEHERETAYRVLQLTLWIGGIVVVLGVWDVQIGGLLIGAGFLGIVVGLAARQTLGSLLAGLVLMFSRPFEVGDWVEVGEDEGIVTDITMMNTAIQAFDGEFVVVPNDVISSQTVRNRSRKGRLRIEVEVGVDYTCDVERAREVATEAVSELDIVMDVPRPEAVTKSLDDSAVTIGVRGWIEHPSSRRRWRARTGMVREVKRRFAEEGIKIPFPQRELSGREEHGGLRVQDGEVSAGEDRGAGVDAAEAQVADADATADSAGDDAGGDA